MRQMLLDIRQAGESVTSYASDWEYLADELRRLDLLIRLLLSQEQHEKPENVLDQFRGLVVSDEEIARLLADPGRPDFDDCPLRHERQDQKELAETIGRLESCIQRRLAVSDKDDVCLSLPLLAHLFHLTRFEEQCLIICLAPELDRKYEKLYAYLQDDVTRKKPSADLALNLLCRTMPEKLAARAVFDPRAPLLKYRLLQMTHHSPDDPTPLLQRLLKLDDRIVNFVLGFRQMDARLGQSARLITPGAEAHPAPEVEELRVRMGDFLKIHFSESQSPPGNILFYLRGPYGSGKRKLAETVSHDLGLPVIVGDVEQMLGGPLGFEQAVLLLSREAVLQPAALCLENLDGLLAEPDKHRAQLKSLVDAVRTFSRLTFLLGAQAWRLQGWFDNETFVALEMPRTDVVSRKQHWESYLNGHYRFADDVDWGALAGKFRLYPGQMREALAAAENLARWRASADAQITMADLHQACRAQSTPKLEALAHKIEPKRQWHEIVLPDDQLAQIREICEQVNHRQKVYDEWGFARKLSRGRGLNALFSGPPGTGKTMAAEILARELQLDLYQIDLSQVVSKYIGETEKNLHRIFAEAQSSNAILFFDEADALFGKRSEVKDAHDRYANIEVGYLLQKMEEYEGIAILATNLRQHLDEAFVRRMQFIVEFPFPDEESRRRIWQVTFPDETPLAAEVDFSLLAREIKLAGGNIKNISLAAAFYAAGDGGVVRLPHLAQAARREFQKLGRTWSDTSRILTCDVSSEM
jgi:ATP-dependent 26S proteasome regulatory subunit